MKDTKSVILGVLEEDAIETLWAKLLAWGVSSPKTIIEIIFTGIEKTKADVSINKSALTSDHKSTRAAFYKKHGGEKSVNLRLSIIFGLQEKKILLKPNTEVEILQESEDEGTLERLIETIGGEDFWQVATPNGYKTYSEYKLFPQDKIFRAKQKLFIQGLMACFKKIKCASERHLDSPSKDQEDPWFDLLETDLPEALDNIDDKRLLVDRLTMPFFGEGLLSRLVFGADPEMITYGYNTNSGDTKSGEFLNFFELFRALNHSSFLLLREGVDSVANTSSLLLRYLCDKDPTRTMNLSLTSDTLNKWLIGFINPTLETRICDPACGAGGTIKAIYQSIIEQHGSQKYNDFITQQANLGSAESANQKDLIPNPLLVGFDSNSNPIEIAKANFALQYPKANQPSWQLTDFLSESLGSNIAREKMFSGRKYITDFDLIISDPLSDVISGVPYGHTSRYAKNRQGTDRPKRRHHRLSIGGNLEKVDERLKKKHPRGQWLDFFILRTLDILVEGGCAVIIVPNDFTNQTLHKRTRDALVLGNTLLAVITDSEESLVLFKKGGLTENVFLYDLAIGSDEFSFRTILECSMSDPLNTDFKEGAQIINAFNRFSEDGGLTEEHTDVHHEKITIVSRKEITESRTLRLDRSYYQHNSADDESYVESSKAKLSSLWDELNALQKSIQHEINDPELREFFNRERGSE